MLCWRDKSDWQRPLSLLISKSKSARPGSQWQCQSPNAWGNASVSVSDVNDSHTHNRNTHRLTVTHSVTVSATRRTRAVASLHFFHDLDGRGIINLTQRSNSMDLLC